MLGHQLEQLRIAFALPGRQWPQPSDEVSKLAAINGVQLVRL